MDDATRPPADDSGTDWLLPPAAAADEIRSDARVATRRPTGVAVALVAAGALAGAIVVSLLHDSGSARSGTTALPAAATNGVPGGQLPGGQQLRGGTGDTDDDGSRGFGAPRDGGGLSGEQRLRGTLTAVGASTVTVRTSAGTQTYTVVGSTEIVRNGSPATLSQLRAGDPVFLHVYPSSSGGSLLVERIFAGTLPSFGGPPPQQGTPQQQTSTT